MKRFIIAAVLLFVAASLFAQSATLATQIQPPARTSIVVGSITERRAEPSDPATAATASVELWLMAGDGSRHDVWTIQLVGAEVVSLINAQLTPIAGETGTNVRKKNARVLKFLKDNCATFETPCPPAVPAVTVVP